MTQIEKDELLRRLSRIKGQVEGIMRMVEHPRPAHEVFNQITAAKKALDSTGRSFLENYIKDNIKSLSRSKEEESKVKEILEIIEKF
jgi:CsoR family transcriptional regulator, copper-sensing transcriptional repressor